MTNIHSLIMKAKDLRGIKPIAQNEIITVQNELKIILSDDFLYLAKYCSYEFLGGWDFCNFGRQGVYSVIFETKSLRKALNLPNEYLILSIDDVSVLLLKTISSTKSQVIWCDEPDFFNLCEGKPFEYKVTTFPSFTDFYAFLIDEEEKIGEEE